LDQLNNAVIVRGRAFKRHSLALGELLTRPLGGANLIDRWAWAALKFTIELFRGLLPIAGQTTFLHLNKSPLFVESGGIRSPRWV
jgi:hypothetical protein